MVWGMTTKAQLNRVQILQNFAAKVAIGGAGKYDHVTTIINKLEWLKIDEKCQYDLCITVFKSLRHYLPEWLFSLPTVSQVRRTCTRQSSQIFVRRTATDKGKKAFIVTGAMLWNDLPLDIKSTNCLLTFKNKLKCHLLKKRT